MPGRGGALHQIGDDPLTLYKAFGTGAPLPWVSRVKSPGMKQNNHPGTGRAHYAIHCQLGEGLRRTYEPLVREPLPSDFLKLIDDLEARRSLSAEGPHGIWERLRKRLG